jgi:hypothetical protein
MYTMNAVKVDSAKRIRLTVLTPGDYYEPEVRGRAAEEITLRRMPPPRRRFTKVEALRTIEKSLLRFTHSWDQVKEETRRRFYSIPASSLTRETRTDGRLVRPTLREPLLGLEIGTSQSTLPVGAGRYERTPHIALSGAFLALRASDCIGWPRRWVSGRRRD